jgi:hypothetical protein
LLLGPKKKEKNKKKKKEETVYSEVRNVSIKIRPGY